MEANGVRPGQVDIANEALDRGWKYIEHAFGQVAPETVVLAQIDETPRNCLSSFFGGSVMTWVIIFEVTELELRQRRSPFIVSIRRQL
jgi:hypothetical protein